MIEERQPAAIRRAGEAAADVKIQTCRRRSFVGSASPIVSLRTASSGISLLPAVCLSARSLSKKITSSPPLEMSMNPARSAPGRGVSDGVITGSGAREAKDIEAKMKLKRTACNIAMA